MNITTTELVEMLANYNPRANAFISLKAFSMSGDGTFFKGVKGSRKAIDKRKHKIIPYRSHACQVGSDYITKLTNELAKKQSVMEHQYSNNVERKEDVKNQLADQIEEGRYTKISNVLYVDNRTNKKLLRFYNPMSETIAHYDGDLTTVLTEELIAPYRKPYVERVGTKNVNGFELETELQVRGVSVSGVREITIDGTTYTVTPDLAESEVGDSDGDPF